MDPIRVPGPPLRRCTGALRSMLDRMRGNEAAAAPRAATAAAVDVDLTLLAPPAAPPATAAPPAQDTWLRTQPDVRFRA